MPDLSRIQCPELILPLCSQAQTLKRKGQKNARPSYGHAFGRTDSRCPGNTGAGSEPLRLCGPCSLSSTANSLNMPLRADSLSQTSANRLLIASFASITVSRAFQGGGLDKEACQKTKLPQRQVPAEGLPV